MIKTNIKMRVTPEQSRKVQKICFENGIGWSISGSTIKYLDKPYLVISQKEILFRYESDILKLNPLFKEARADLFIRTNGTCQEKYATRYSKRKQ